MKTSRPHLIASAVAGLPDEDFAKLQARVKALKIPIRAANSFVPGTIKLTGPDTDPAKQQEYVRRCLGRLSQIGVKIADDLRIYQLGYAVRT